MATKPKEPKTKPVKTVKAAPVAVEAPKAKRKYTPRTKVEAKPIKSDKPKAERRKEATAAVLANALAGEAIVGALDDLTKTSAAKPADPPPKNIWQKALQGGLQSSESVVKPVVREIPPWEDDPQDPLPVKAETPAPVAKKEKIWPMPGVPLREKMDKPSTHSQNGKLRIASLFQPADAPAKTSSGKISMRALMGY